nr:hypothetical protein [Devosia sp.]
MGSFAKMRRQHNRIPRLFAHCSFRPKLIDVLAEAIDVDRADPNRPVAAIARLVAQIGVLVGCADNDAMPGVGSGVAGIGGAIDVILRGEEALDGIQRGLARAVQFLTLDNPCPRDQLGLGLGVGV